mgnify:FL=1
MKYLFLFSVLLISSCVNAPKIIADKGAVYGMISADVHPAFKKKMLNNSNSFSGYSEAGVEGGNNQDKMIDYSQLNELYVGLVLPDYRPQQHQLVAYREKMSLRSLALSIGDELYIHNKSATVQNFFVSEIGGEGFQSFSALEVGQSAHFTVKLAGNLELLSEENDQLKTILFSKKNMRTKKLSSGQTYQFENLKPGLYRLIFWYWRLGKIEQTISIKSQENLRIDKTLTVDSVMRAN